jgi:hypothetical protein
MPARTNALPYAKPLTTLDGDRYRATFVGRIPPRRWQADSTLTYTSTMPPGRRDPMFQRHHLELEILIVIACLL